MELVIICFVLIGMIAGALDLPLYFQTPVIT